MALKVSESEFCSANRTRNIPLSGRRYEMYACANAFAFRWDKHTGAKLSGLLLKPATARTKCVSRYTSEACRVFFCRVFFWVSRLAEEEPVEKEEDPTRPPLLALTATTWYSVARSAAKIPPPDDEVLPLVPRLKAPRHTDRNASRNAFRFVTENGKGAQHPSADPGHQVAETRKRKERVSLVSSCRATRGVLVRCIGRCMDNSHRNWSEQSPAER